MMRFQWGQLQAFRLFCDRRLWPNFAAIDASPRHCQQSALATHLPHYRDWAFRRTAMPLLI